jgi:hypothetical protein
MLKGKLTISRVDSSRENPVVEIRVMDEISGVTFVEASISMNDFAMALTGMSRQPIEFEVDGLAHIGKRKESMPLEFPIGNWLTPEDGAIAACPEGWEPVLYFGSQSSKFTRDGQQWARTTAERWADAE